MDGTPEFWTEGGKCEILEEKSIVLYATMERCSGKGGVGWGGVGVVVFGSAAIIVLSLSACEWV